MIQCFKSMAQKHNLSIITSIHQPNLEILMIFDLLYVLAKGGVCVFSGRPQHLRKHLSDCQIFCRKNQIPIEILLKIGAKGHSDESVIKLSEKTTQDMIGTEQRIATQLRLYANGIPIKSKSFSIEEMRYLLVRMIISTVRYEWTQVCGQTLIYLLSAFFITIHFDFDLERPSSCVPKVSNSCDMSSESIEENKLLNFNASLIMIVVILVMIVTTCLMSVTFPKQFKVFLVEHRNCKNEISVA